MVYLQSRKGDCPMTASHTYSWSHTQKSNTKQFRWGGVPKLGSKLPEGLNGRWLNATRTIGWLCGWTLICTQLFTYLFCFILFYNSYPNQELRNFEFQFCRLCECLTIFIVILFFTSPTFFLFIAISFSIILKSFFLINQPHLCLLHLVHQIPSCHHLPVVSLVSSPFTPTHVSQRLPGLPVRAFRVPHYAKSLRALFGYSLRLVTAKQIQIFQTTHLIYLS